MSIESCYRIENILIHTYIFKKYYTRKKERMRSSGVFILGIIVVMTVVVSSNIHYHSKQQIQSKIANNKIMYGATIRLKNIVSAYHLHSHHVNYPRSSGLQSVTGFPGDNDYNSLWTIKQANDENVKTYYHQLLCGDTIRLEHALTKRNLHSEEIYQSMISGGQQVSAFGNSGEGDDNDNWILRCVNKNQGDQFYGGDIFELVHQNTQKRIKASRYYEYSFNTWENCPFQGQIQISGVPNHSRETQWKIVGGVFFKDSNKKSSNPQSTDDEDL